MQPPYRQSERQGSYRTEALAQSQVSGNTFRTCSTSCNSSSGWGGIWGCTWPWPCGKPPPTALATAPTPKLRPFTKGRSNGKFGKSVWQNNKDSIYHTLRCGTSSNTETSWVPNVPRWGAWVHGHFGTGTGTSALRVQGAWGTRTWLGNFDRKSSPDCRSSSVCLFLVSTECPCGLHGGRCFLATRCSACSLILSRCCECLAKWLESTEHEPSEDVMVVEHECYITLPCNVTNDDGHSSGAVWESRWPSWAVRPNEPSGFRGRKAILNHASALVSACP